VSSVHLTRPNNFTGKAHGGPDAQDGLSEGGGGVAAAVIN
jgi:hypothetical protein